MKSVLNNKGYMLVEIIVASAIALTMAFFLMEMTLKIVNSNNDYYEESVLLFDKNIVTKEIMDDVNGKQLSSVEYNSDSSYTLTFDDGTTKNLSVNIETKTITYGSYTKKLSDKLNMDNIEIKNDETNKMLTLIIPAYSNYSKEDYGVSIVIPYKSIRVSLPEIKKDLCVSEIEKLGLIDDYKGDLGTFSNISTDADTGIYTAEDDLGKSCYFRGNVKNNYVKYESTFNLHTAWDNRSGNPIDGIYSDEECELIFSRGFICDEPETVSLTMYWRILRINGDGTIRLIYDGKEAYDNNASSKENYAEISFFNSETDDNAYVGYMYGDINSSYEETHTNINNSNIKIFFEGDKTNTQYTNNILITGVNPEGWYKDNIVYSGLDDYVTDAIYCNDRTLSAGNIPGAGVGTGETRYGSYDRNFTIHTIPSLKCSRMEDRFTIGTDIGNGKNVYPVGLITWDELIFAGSYYGKTNKNYYLNSNKSYFTMTPFSFTNGSAMVGVSAQGVIVSANVGNVEYAIRPVISIKADSIKSGKGTIDNPFIIGI